MEANMQYIPHIAQALPCLNSAEQQPKSLAAAQMEESKLGKLASKFAKLTQKPKMQ